jgi:hypothetical protein
MRPVAQEISLSAARETNHAAVFTDRASVNQQAGMWTEAS